MEQKRFRSTWGIILLLAISLVVAMLDPVLAKVPDTKDIAKLSLTREEAKKLGLKICFQRIYYDPQNPTRNVCALVQDFRCLVDEPYRKDPVYKEYGFPGAVIRVCLSYMPSPKARSEMLQSIIKNYKMEKPGTYKQYMDGIVVHTETIKYELQTHGNSIFHKETHIHRYFSPPPNRHLELTKTSSSCNINTMVGNFWMSVEAELCSSEITGPNAKIPRLTYCNTLEKMKQLVKLYYKKIAALEGIKGQPPDIQEGERKGLSFKLRAEKKGYEPDRFQVSLSESESKARSLLVKGTVYDKHQNPIPLARMTLTLNGKTFITTCGKNGSYSLRVPLNPKGSGEITREEDFSLKKELSKATVKVLSGNLVANGRSQTITLQVTDAQGPARNKKFTIISGKKPITCRGKVAGYIRKPIVSLDFTTDSRGRATITLQAPRADKEKLNATPHPELFFPVTSQFSILSYENRELQKVGDFTLDYKSPYPRIVRFTVPGNLEVGHWQVVPSRVVIDDADSNRFNIVINGRGRFRVKGGPVYTDGYKEYNFSGKTFEFLYASNQIGLDLNNQPDLWKELLDTNMKNALNFSLALLEGYGLKVAKKAGRFNPNLTDKVSSETVTAAGKLAIGGLAYYNATVNTFKVKDKKDLDKVAVGDWVVGGVSLGYDAYSFITKASSTLGGTLQLEAAKAIYENAKTVYNTYKKYREISDSYRDVIFIPILVTVSDPDGYKTIALGTCSVRIWKGVE